MSRQTKPGLASIVQAYSTTAGDLLAELSEATEGDEKCSDVVFRMVQAFSCFQMDVKEAM
jgi:hypothetical protein